MRTNAKWLADVRLLEGSGDLERSNDSQADASFVDSEFDEYLPCLDITIANPTHQPMLVTRLDTTINRIWEFRQVPTPIYPTPVDIHYASLSHPFEQRLLPSGFPYKPHLSVAIEIPPAGTGNLQIVFKEDHVSPYKMYYATITIFTSGETKPIAKADVLMLCGSRKHVLPTTEEIERAIENDTYHGETVNRAAIHEALAENRRIIHEVAALKLTMNPALQEMVNGIRKGINSP